jgi:hypothetical protein
LEQYRRFSGTRGSASTALAGSREGTGGISTRPAPRRPRADRPEVRRDLERELRLPESGPELADDSDPAAASPQVSQ